MSFLMILLKSGLFEENEVQSLQWQRFTTFELVSRIKRIAR